MVETKLSYIDLEDENANEIGYVDADYSIAELEAIASHITKINTEPYEKNLLSE